MTAQKIIPMEHRLEHERYAIVAKSNDLITARQDLTLIEQKIILYLISKVKKEDDNFKWYEFHISEFCRICGIDTGGKNYKRIREILLNLHNKAWWQQLPDGKIVTMSWINKAMMEPKKGTISVRLDDDLKPFLLHLQANFTMYQLIHCLGFKSKYTLCLYENICRIHFHPLTPFTKKYTREEFYALFNATQKAYAEWKDFKRRILDPACQEINERSNKTITYVTVLTGRRVTAIELTVMEKDSLETLAAEIVVNRELNEKCNVSGCAE